MATSEVVADALVRRLRRDVRKTLRLSDVHRFNGSGADAQSAVARITEAAANVVRGQRVQDRLCS